VSPHIRRPLAVNLKVNARDRLSLLTCFLLCGKVCLRFSLSLPDFLLLPGLLFVLVEVGRRTV
jgi:hypothetical protein